MNDKTKELTKEIIRNLLSEFTVQTLHDYDNCDPDKYMDQHEPLLNLYTEKVYQVVLQEIVESLKNVFVEVKNGGTHEK